MLAKIRTLLNFSQDQKTAGHLQAGSAAEVTARKHLENLGFKTVVTNLTSRFGEIDIVMNKKNTLVFVEVRYRKNPGFGTAAQSVTIHKQRKLINAARYFLQKNPEYRKYDSRFDVITIESRKNILQWYPCAFTLDSHCDYNF